MTLSEYSFQINSDKVHIRNFICSEIASHFTKMEIIIAAFQFKLRLELKYKAFFVLIFQKMPCQMTTAA